MTNKKLNFNTHINDVCTKAGQKICVIENNSFHGVAKGWSCHISVQLLPSSLLCLRKIKSNMINHVLERCLRIIYDHKYGTIEKLLGKDNSVTITVENTVISPNFLVCKFCRKA